MEEKLLTGVKNVDMEILQKLEDSDFIKVPNICSINNYIKSICDDDLFWMNRFILKYKEEGKEKEFEKLKKLRDEFNKLPNLSDPKIKLEISYKQLYAAMRLDENDKGLGIVMRKDYLPLYKLIPKTNVTKRNLLIFAAQVNAKNIIISELLTDSTMERVHANLTEMAKYMTAEIYNYFVLIGLEDRVIHRYLAGLIERYKNPEKEIKRIIDEKGDDVNMMYILYDIDFKNLEQYTAERNKRVFDFLMKEKIITRADLNEFIKVGNVFPKWLTSF